MRIEFLWFRDCPNHELAREMLKAALFDRGVVEEIEEIDATEPAVASAHRFPGSPTIRIDGSDVEPGFEDTGDYTPRCRLYFTGAVIKGVSEAAWMRAAIDAALARK